jgi:hypothetical protein
VVSPTCNSLAGRGQFTEGTLACPPGTGAESCDTRATGPLFRDMGRELDASHAAKKLGYSGRRLFVYETFAPSVRRTHSARARQGPGTSDRRIEDSFAPAAIRTTREPRLTS